MSKAAVSKKKPIGPKQALKKTTPPNVKTKVKRIAGADDYGDEAQETIPALQEFFVSAIKDIFWAENHLVNALPKMIRAATSGTLKTAIGNHLEETRTHVERLIKVFEILGKKPQAKKCGAVEGITMEGEEIIEETKKGTATRDAGIVLASQKVEHYEIATYGGLIKLALVIGQEEVAELLSQTLDEEKAADQKLSDIAENEINNNASAE